MTIRYLFHSGFSVESQDCTIVIDYYLDSCEGNRTIEKGVVDDDLLSRPGRFYVLSSHSHADHFNPRVLDWQKKRKDIQYILSRDILLMGKAHQADNVHALISGDSYEDDCLRIEAFGSTDLGVSFVIQKDGLILFHAGDLNNWHWNREADAEFSQAAEQAYLLELHKLQQKMPHMDVAMFPVDPRLGPDCGRGAEQLLDAIDVKTLIPMHFSSDDREPLNFKNAHPNRSVIPLVNRGETFAL